MTRIGMVKMTISVKMLEIAFAYQKAVKLMQVPSIERS